MVYNVRRALRLLCSGVINDSKPPQIGERGWRDMVIKHVNQYGQYHLTYNGHELYVAKSKISDDAGMGLFVKNTMEQGTVLCNDQEVFGKGHEIQIPTVENALTADIKEVDSTYELIVKYKGAKYALNYTEELSVEKHPWLLEPKVLDYITMGVRDKTVVVQNPYEYPLGFINSSRDSQNLYDQPTGTGNLELSTSAPVQAGEELLWFYHEEALHSAN